MNQNLPSMQRRTKSGGKKSVPVSGGMKGTASTKQSGTMKKGK